MSLSVPNRDVVPVLRGGSLPEQRNFLVCGVGFELSPKVQLLQVCFAKALTFRAVPHHFCPFVRFADNLELRRGVGIVDTPSLDSYREEQAILTCILIEPVDGASVFF